MSPLALVCWLLYLGFDTGGHLAFKAASNVAERLRGRERWLAMAQCRWIWIGCICFAFQLAVWIAFLSLVKLSVGILMASVDIITIMLGGHLAFGEPLTRRRLAAAAVITIGIALVGWGGS